LRFPFFAREAREVWGNQLSGVPNPLQMRVSEIRWPKIRQKSAFYPQKPKKIVEKPHFPIDFVPAQAAW
jgi:hypothetical protein